MEFGKKTKTTTTMRELSEDDFKGFDFSNKSPFDIFVHVCSVAYQILHHDQKINVTHALPLRSISPDGTMTYFTATSTTASDGDGDNTAGLHRFLIHNPPTRKRSRISRNKPSSSCSSFSSSSSSVIVAAAHPHQEHNHYEDDGDWQELISTKKPKMQKKTNKKSSTAKRAPVQLMNSYRPDLPQRYRERIRELQGTDIRLVIQKGLYSTDLTQNHNRLSIPFNQIISGDFLAQEEKEWLRTKHPVEVPLMVMTRMEEADVIQLTLRQWDMPKPNGRTSHLYALSTHWHRQVVKGHGLVEGEVVQVWSFRVEGRLHMALVVVSRELQQAPAAANSSGSSNATASASGSSVVTDQAQVS